MVTSLKILSWKAYVTILGVMMVLMMLFMSMNYNMIDMLLVVDVLNLYMLNVEVECGDCMYNIGNDLCEYMHCCCVIYSCIHD